MAKIYVIGSIKEVMRKIREPIPLIRRGQKIIVIFKQFSENELLLENTPLFSYIMLTFKVTIYTFFEMIKEVLHSLKKMKTSSGPIMYESR